MNGCDSIVTLDLSMNYESDTVLYVSSLGTYKLNGYSYSEAGVYQQDTLTEFGCDSTITLNLNIDESGIQNLEHLGLQVFPNPFWSEISVNFEKLEDICTISLVDARGRVVYFDSQITVKNKFDLSFLEPGVYYLNINTKESVLGRIKMIRR